MSVADFGSLGLGRRGRLRRVAQERVWRKNDGSPGGYNMWRANFGMTFGSGSSLNAAETSPAVPEPTLLNLIVSVVLGSLALGRIRRASLQA